MLRVFGNSGWLAEEYQNQPMFVQNSQRRVSGRELHRKPEKKWDAFNEHENVSRIHLRPSKKLPQQSAGKWPPIREGRTVNGFRESVVAKT
jgi:hypothetical protein